LALWAHPSSKALLQRPASTAHQAPWVHRASTGPTELQALTAYPVLPLPHSASMARLASKALKVRLALTVRRALTELTKHRASCLRRLAHTREEERTRR
jgi:hypothetical protein